MSDPDPMATPSPNDQIINSSTTSIPAESGFAAASPPPLPVTDLTASTTPPANTIDTVPEPVTVPENLQESLQEKLGYEAEVSATETPPAASYPSNPVSKSPNSMGTMLKIGGAVAALVVFISGGLMALNAFRPGETTELRSSARSSCSIVDTDQGPGCWCQDGGWQFHCSADGKRGDPASGDCRNRCGDANKDDSDIVYTCNKNGVCDFDETADSCKDCRDGQGEDEDESDGKTGSDGKPDDGGISEVQCKNAAGADVWCDQCGGFCALKLAQPGEGCANIAQRLVQAGECSTGTERGDIDPGKYNPEACNLYQCPGEFSFPSEGCQKGVNPGVNEFESPYCGLQQIDCTGNGFRSKIDSSGCKKGDQPKPPKPPKASQPPGAPPSDAPEPSNKPPAGLVCTGLGSSKTAPIIGDSVTFTCSSKGTNQVDHFEFRFKVGNGNYATLPSGTASGSDKKFTGTSQLVVSQAGDHKIQCRVCKKPNGECTNWGKKN